MAFLFFFLYSKTWFINDLISVVVCVQDLLEDKFYKFLLKACMFACLVIEFHGILGHLPIKEAKNWSSDKDSQTAIK